MLACHAGGPGSIPGRCKIFFQSHQTTVRMAERSKALRSGRSPLLWAWVRIPLLTRNLLDGLVVPSNFLSTSTDSRVAQWKRAGPITQRSVDRNYALLAAFGFHDDIKRP